MDYSCKLCGGHCIKKGYQRGKQKLLCKNCNKYQQSEYSYQAYRVDLDLWIFRYLTKGMSIRDISRTLEISSNTLTRRIIKIAKGIPRPSVLKGKTYELDELRTYVRCKRNLYYVISAYCRETKEIVAFKVGKRNNTNLGQVVNTLLLSDAKKIYTDKLRSYPTLIPREIHNTKKYGINHLERYHLSMRTDLRRLMRKTICYSKSLIMLSSTMKIYLWGEEKLFENGYI